MAVSEKRKLTNVVIPTKPVTNTVDEKTLHPIDVKWEKTCKLFKEKLTHLHSNYIQVYYDIGLQVLNITQHPKSWGMHTVDNFAEQLDLSKSTIAAAARFSSSVTPHEVSFFLKCKLSWSAAITLISVKDPAIRHKLCEMYAKKSWTTDRLKDEVNRLQPAELKDTPKSKGGMNPAICFKKAINQVSELAKTLPEYQEHLKSYLSLSEEDRSSKAQSAHLQSIDRLKYLHKEVGILLDTIENSNQNTK